MSAPGSAKGGAQGRARGRARGRGRGTAAGGAAAGGGGQAPPAPRPGAPQQGPPPPAAQQKSAPPQPLPGSGRASQRGGARGEPRPGGASGGDDGALARQMAAATLSGGGEGRGRRRDAFLVDMGVKTRPHHVKSKQGTSGRAIMLSSNYFRLQQAPDWQLYQYHVGFTPEVESKRLRMWLVKSLAPTLGATRAFDGMVLFLPKRLPSDKTELQAAKNDGTKIRVTFTLTAELPPDSPTCLHMYNVIFRRILSMIDMEQIGRHYFSPRQGVTIPRHKLEVWPGFITSIMQYESSVMLCAEIQHKILRSDTMLDIMYDMYNDGRGGFHNRFIQKYVGQIVLTRYNNKTYRIDDIDWDNNPQNFRFKLKDGREVNLVEYYKEHYNENITDMVQPLLISMPKKRDERRGQTDPIRLVPELCRLTGLSDEVRADFNVMRDIAVHTRVNPTERRAKLSRFNEILNTNPKVKEELAGWCMKFQRDLVPIKARTLELEKIYQLEPRSGQTAGYQISPKADWGPMMRNYHLLSTVTLQPRRWILMFTRRDAQCARALIPELVFVSKNMGFTIGEPRFCELNDDQANTYDRALQQEIRGDTQLVMCVVPNNRGDRYSAIKKRCCIRSPVVSQVVVARTLMKQKMLRSVATKIAIQLNCKLGGDAWAVGQPMNNIMVVGVDCYHDSSRKDRSVAAFVASTNVTLTKYYSRCTFQTQQQEMIDGLKVSMVGALQHYRHVNGVLPDKIFIYRDGVGDGQLPSLVEHEIPQLLESFKDLGDMCQPKVAYVVVKKRINSRFFAHAGDTLQNPPPGTIVDSEVTNPDWYDFFLVSQSVNQGTVTPTSYNVVWDTVALGADKMQRFSYKLTHLYFNWPGTIRVPAPCQYAHKLAFLVGQSLHDDPAPALWDKLFYL